MAVFVFTTSCAFSIRSDQTAMTKSGLKYDDFEREIDGKQTRLYALTNQKGMEVSITNYGARIVSILAPDRNQQFADIVLGFSTIEEYLNANESYFGATIGRYANRIANASFTINDSTYHLVQNNGENSLHGGPGGFHNVVWKVTSHNKSRIELKLLSLDGEEGFPGNLDIKMSYELNDQNQLIIEYHGVSDKETCLNLTHHSFFNLRGEGNGDIVSHKLIIDASEYTPVDSSLIPLGISPVSGTPFDFRTPIKIGDRINQDHIQIKYGGGFDHNFVLSKKRLIRDNVYFAAKVTEPESGRFMEVYTNEPGIQFYSGNFLRGKDVGKSGKPYELRSALCLETQHFPDSPNHPEFPSTIISPQNSYKSICIYKFGVE